MTLTETAINWLSEQQKILGANSLGDVIERIARKQKALKSATSLSSTS